MVDGNSPKSGLSKAQVAQVHPGLPGNGKRIIEADPFSLGKPMDFFLQTPMDSGEAWGGLGRLGEAWGGLGKRKSLRHCWDFLGFLRNVVSVQQLSCSCLIRCA